jgi:hypothetical protein
VATAIVIGLVVLVAVGLVFYWALSRRRARAAGSLPLAGRDRETLQGDRADRQAATEDAARDRRPA